MSEIKFHFLKKADCKEILVDGAFGGLTPRGRISMAVYTERTPIPQETVHELTDLELGPEIADRRIGRENFVRVVDAVLHFDIETAKVINQWLAGRIDELEKTLAAKK